MKKDNYKRIGRVVWVLWTVILIAALIWSVYLKLDMDRNTVLVLLFIELALLGIGLICLNEAYPEWSQDMYVDGNTGNI